MNTNIACTPAPRVDNVSPEEPRPRIGGSSAAGRIGHGARRSRMISFRLTDREFEALKVKAEAEGARNVSDFARMALCGEPQAVAERIDQRMTELSAEIQQLTADIRRMSQIVEGPRRMVAGTPARKNGRH